MLPGLLSGEGKGIEALVAVEGVGSARAFEPVDDQVGQGRGQDLVADLESISGGDGIEQSARWDGSGEGEGDDEGGVNGLADDGGPDGASPEHAAVGEELEAGHGVGVGELAGPEGDETGGEDARDEAEDGGEGLLVLPAGGGGQRDDDGAHEVEQRGAEEAQPDGSPGGGEAVDLSEDVAEDVGDGKEKDGSADGEGADQADLLGDEIRDEQDDDEGRGKGVEIFIAGAVGIDEHEGSVCTYLTRLMARGGQDALTRR